MKKLVITTSILFSVFHVFAQTSGQSSETKPVYVKGQVGINATSFLKQFIVLNNTAVGQTSPFDFNAKVFAGWNRYPNLLLGPRFGFGYHSTHNYSNNEQQSNERSDDSKSRSVRAGLELQQTISKRWVIYYGLDYVNMISNTSTVSVSQIFNPTPPFEPINVRTEIITNNKTTGGGPVLGVQFNINKHFCLGTEASFYYLQNRGGEKTISDNPNNTVPEVFTDSRTHSIQLPFFINCNVVF